MSTIFLRTDHLQPQTSFWGMLLQPMGGRSCSAGERDVRELSADGNQQLYDLVLRNVKLPLNLCLWGTEKTAN